MKAGAGAVVEVAAAMEAAVGALDGGGAAGAGSNRAGLFCWGRLRVSGG